MALIYANQQLEVPVKIPLYLSVVISFSIEDIQINKSTR
jgi:hypothetical protein